MSRPAAVSEIRETLADPTGAGPGVIEVDVVYWQFEMTLYDRSNPYWMITLKFDGKLWAGFADFQGDARVALRQYSFDYTSLAMPWTVFRRAARRALDAAPSRRRIHLPEGYFVKLSDTEIVYTTECDIEYHLTAETLKGLLR